MIAQPLPGFEPELSIVPVPTIPEPPPYCTVESILIGNVQYLVKKGEGTSLSKDSAIANGITQVHVSYRDYKKLLYNAHKHQVSKTVIHLPAPRKVNYLADHPLIGQTIAVSGFAQESYVMCVFDRISDGVASTWVQLRAQIGKHSMTTYRLLTDLENEEQS